MHWGVGGVTWDGCRSAAAAAACTRVCQPDQAIAGTKRLAGRRRVRD
jgi:hypothetical protein